MTKKIIKLAVIRRDTDNPCPFGLSIPFACERAGELVDRMAPVEVLGPEATEEEIKLLSEANNNLFNWEHESKRCKYANSIVADKKATDCNFEETNAGVSLNAPLKGAPFYSRVYDNVSLDGTTNIPIGEYRDENMSRNLYYGIFSLLGSEIKKDIEKFSSYIINLNDNINSLEPEEREILYNYASIYANKKGLIKTAKNANIDRIFEILETWKDLK